MRADLLLAVAEFLETSVPDEQFDYNTIWCRSFQVACEVFELKIDEVREFFVPAEWSRVLAKYSPQSGARPQTVAYWIRRWVAAKLEQENGKP